MTEPLTKGQQMLLQRLMANHVMTDAEATTLFEQIKEANDIDIGRCNDLKHALDKINKQLRRGFGLQIATMVSTSDILPPAGQKFHAIIDQHADDVAKESFLSHYDMNERAYLRIILEYLACTEPSPIVARSTLINQRLELKDPYKLSLDGAGTCIDKLIDEHWLTMVDETHQRRDSMTANIQLGPRAYLELSHLLIDYGFPKEDLPQFIFYK